MANKKRFYGDAVTSGASAISVQMPRIPDSGYAVPPEGVPVTLADISSGTIGSTSGGPYLPVCDAARIASIIVPAGVHAIINFRDGRQFVCHCADKPVKVKPSMLAPAHAWRDTTENTVLFSFLLCDATGKPLFGDGAANVGGYKGKVSGIQVNVALRLH